MPRFTLVDDTRSRARPCKVVVVGDSGCGKTSLLASYVQGRFPETYEPTIFENQRALVADARTGTVLAADLWDTAGQEEYERLRRLSYADADVVIVAYAVDAPESLANIHEVWAPETMTYAPHACIVLAGLKSDRVPAVDPLREAAVARNIGAVAHVKCAAISMTHVDALFDAVFGEIVNKERKFPVAPERAEPPVAATHRRNVSISSLKKSSKSSKSPKSSKPKSKALSCTIL